MFKVVATIMFTSAFFLALHVTGYDFFPCALALTAGFGFCGVLLMGGE